MQMRVFVGALLTLWAAAAVAQVKYCSIYLLGGKIGYLSTDEYSVQYQGRSAIRTDTHVVTESSSEGVITRIVEDESAWTNPEGRPFHVKTTVQSGGRAQTLDAIYGPKTVTLFGQSGGTKTQQTIKIPDGTIAEDGLLLLKLKNPAPGEKVSYWTLDAENNSFKKEEAKFIGPSVTTVRGKKIGANLFETSVFGSTMRVYETPSWDLVRMEGEMGMEILPVPKEVALLRIGKGSEIMNLDAFTKLKTDKPVPDADHRSALRVRFTGCDLSAAPSDVGQSVTKDGAGWIVEIHPTRFDSKVSAPTTELSVDKAKWIEPSKDIPSDSTTFQELARKIVGAHLDVVGKTTAIMHYVNRTMKYKDGIGISRDAAENLSSKEGVCRDFAILAATLLRAAGIPARIATGLIYDEQAFCAHAWTEVWDGHNWVGLDPTNDVLNLSAEYIKLGQGGVDEATSADFPFKAKIAILTVRH